MKHIKKWIALLGSIFIISNTFSQETVDFAVGGACSMCKARIEKVAADVKGVESAYFDLSKKRIYVEYDDSDFSLDDLHRAIAASGYDTEQVRAKDEDYEGLEDCCRYRDFGFSPHPDFNTPQLKPAELAELIKGQIMEEDADGEPVPIIGANVMWLGAPYGTATDINGRFELGRIERTSEMVISYIGYDSDTIDMSNRSEIVWMMSGDVILEEVQVVHRKKSTEISFMNPIQTFNVSEDELCKAACCNLSESFETSPAVDVSFTDAVTGTRQIQMLGLAGKYVQITRELIPDIRGLSTIYGLTYTPGAWIESIQLSKGSGSVVNGHESMTGQINVELRKPQKKERFYLNLYANEGGRYEGNLIGKHKFNNNLSTAVLLHGSTRDRRFDRNDDGFLDSPLAKDVIVVNRWKYQNKSGLQAQFGVKLSDIERTSGQLRYNADLDRHSEEIWGSVGETTRQEAWLKVGKVFSEFKNSSIGFQLSAVNHDQDLTFGLRDYISEQTNLYSNLIYQTDLNDPDHSLRAGVTFNWDKIDETVIGSVFNRDEQEVGAYGEYTYRYHDHLTAVVGARADLHNIYGLMWSPRFHLRNAFGESTVARITAGKGWRTANIFAENIGFLASGRQMIVDGETGGDNPYGLNPEQAWNFGANLTQTFEIGGRVASLSLDYYYTLFEDQIVADFESDANGRVIIRNQDEMTKAHSVQTQLDAELFERFDVRLAYRYNYSEVDFGGEMKTLAFTPFHRAFVNMAYETKDHWHFDLTVNWRGEQRIPSTDWLPQELRVDERSPDFFVVNAQIRKIFNDQFELYLGSENLLNYRQEAPIINADDPFSDNFDASLVWGPIFGRNVYAGLRYKIQ